MVTLLLFGETLRQALGKSEFQCEVSEPMTFKALLERNQDRLGGLLPFMNKGELLITVNRKVGGLDSKVKDGDTVKLTHQIHPVHEGATWQNP
jgi:molybdopterin synthase sulfur carrier subunit